jgi:hypothetical protein
MTANEARGYFDSALTLSPGDKLTIPCDSRTDQESARVQLFRNRKAYYMSAGENAITIAIQRLTVSANLAEQYGSKYLIVLFLTKPRIKAVIDRADGSVETFTPTNEPSIEQGNDLTPAQNRAYAFMIADGMDEAEALKMCKEM